MSEGKSLSDREESVLQALEIITRSADGEHWVKGSELRGLVAQLLSMSIDQMGNAQWIGHILNRLHTDKRRRKHYSSGKMYGIERGQVIDMMRRYDVPKIESEVPENRSNRSDRSLFPARSDWFDWFDWFFMRFGI